MSRAGRRGLLTTWLASVSQWIFSDFRQIVMLQARCTVQYAILKVHQRGFFHDNFNKTCRIYPLIGDMRWPVVRDLQQYSRAPRIADQRNNAEYNDTFLIISIITTSLDMSAVSCAVCRDFIVTWRTHGSHHIGCVQRERFIMQLPLVSILEVTPEISSGCWKSCHLQ